MLTTILLASCSKEKTGFTHCEQCIQIISDSTSGEVIKINYGSPTPKAMHYCDGALREVKSQPPVYFHIKLKIHNTGDKTKDISYCQKYEYSCQ